MTIDGLPTLNLALRASDHEIWARQRESWGFFTSGALFGCCSPVARRVVVRVHHVCLPFNFARHNLLGPKCVDATIEL